MNATVSHTTMEDGGEVVALLLPKNVCRLPSYPAITFDDACSGLVGRKRRRSMSPYDRERYDPRPRYDDYGLLLSFSLVLSSASQQLFADSHSRYGYSTSPRRQGPYPPGGRRMAPPDPHTFDYPASLKQYAEWFRYFYPAQATEEDNADKAAEQEVGDGSKPRNGIKTKWEKYKKDFAATQVSTLLISYNVFTLSFRCPYLSSIQAKTCYVL